MKLLAVNIVEIVPVIGPNKSTLWRKGKKKKKKIFNLLDRTWVEMPVDLRTSILFISVI